MEKKELANNALELLKLLYEKIKNKCKLETSTCPFGVTFVIKDKPFDKAIIPCVTRSFIPLGWKCELKFSKEVASKVDGGKKYGYYFKFDRIKKEYLDNLPF